MTHHPVQEFAYALILVLICNFRTRRFKGIVGGVIVLYWTIFSNRARISRTAASDGIGIIEQTLYVYCFTSGHREFIEAVLLFKAFSNWLSFNVSYQNLKDATTSEVDDYRLTLLEQFYAYAVGNFLSLGFAILFYEIVHLWLIRLLPTLPLGFLHT